MKLKKSVQKLLFAASMLTIFSAASGAMAAEDDVITFTFSEHIANVENQAPQVFAVVQAFMETHPNIKIELQGEDNNEHQQKILMAAQSDTLPDLFHVYRMNAIPLVEEGKIADLSELLEDQEWVDGFLPNMLDSMTIDGKLYGIPCEIQCNGIWYNGEIFDKYGLDIPVTFEDYIHCAEVLSAEGIPLIAKGMKENYIWCFYNMFARYGFYDKLDAILAGDEVWANEDFIRFYERVAELREAGAFPENTTTMDYYQAKEMFIAGNAAMLDSGAWDTGALSSTDFAASLGFTWGPTFSDGVGNQEVSSKGAAHPYCVSAKVQQEDPEKFAAILEFLKFYYGEEGTRIIADQTHSIPVTIYNGEISKESQPAFAAIMEKINDDWASPMFAPNYVVPSAMSAPLMESVAGVITGVYTPEEAAQFLDDTMVMTDSFTK